MKVFFTVLVSLLGNVAVAQVVLDTTFKPKDLSFLSNIHDNSDKIKSEYSPIAYEEFENRMKTFISSNNSLGISYHPVLHSYVNTYLSYQWFEKVIGLSEYYFPLFESKLKQYGLPLELKYLAVVESSLNPRAYSSAGAMGLWQFMPDTGVYFNLAMSPEVNLFYDPVASTDAACRYFLYLFNEFNDWNLAISAYNCGIGNVRKAMKKAKSNKYWEVRAFLPAETRSFLPSFIAVQYMFEFYPQHNIYPSYFKFSFFDNKIIKKDKNFKQPSNADFFWFSNPQLLTKVIPVGTYIYISEDI